MGGSAAVLVVLLLVAAFAVALFLARWHPRLSLALAGLATLALVAIESRAGMLALVTWMVIVVVGWARVAPAHPMKLWPLWVACGVIAGAIIAVEPLRRMVSFADPKRAQNLKTALTIWTRGPETVAFGAGPGQVWPWYAFDSAAVPIPGAGVHHTEWGEVLLSPHSTVLAVLVGSGLVGVILGVGFLTALLATLWTSRRAPSRALLAAALTGVALGSAEARAWSRDLKAARATLKAPGDQWQ